MHIDLFLVGALRALIEIAGSALLGQGLLALLAGESRHANLFYKILEIVTTPVVRLTRSLSPSFIADTRVPVLAFFLLFCLWIGLALLKRHLCGLHGLAC
jgi:hypothetical protein